MKEYVIDAKNMDEKELNRTIKQQAPSHDRIIINNPESRHNICAGLCEDVEIEINGSAGYFVATMVNGPRIHIKGNAGWFAGDNMTSGELIIEGTAGDGAGQGIYGGTVIVKGNTGSRTGEIMKGENKMNIIEALVKLRNDLKLWVANNLRVKVDKEEGKGLSSNDFTNELKQKLIK